jgi:hypothetical protein
MDSGSGCLRRGGRKAIIHRRGAEGTEKIPGKLFHRKGPKEEKIKNYCKKRHSSEGWNPVKIEMPYSWFSALAGMTVGVLFLPWYYLMYFASLR